MPNILIITHNPFSRTSNNGKTLEAMFAEYSRENLSVLFFSEMEPDTTFNADYFRITDKDVIKNTILSRKRGYCTITFNDKAEIHGTNINGLFLFIKCFIQRRPYIRDLIWSFGGWKISVLFNWIENNKPDCVFFVGGMSGFSDYIARFIAKKYNLPLFLYLTDDYLIHPLVNSISDLFVKYRIKKMLKRITQQASQCFVIGELMAKEYSEYFGRTFHPIMNMVDEVSPYEEGPIKHEVTIAYYGGLHLNRWKPIVLLAQSLKLINSETMAVSLNVFSPRPSKKVLKKFSQYGIHYRGFLSKEDTKNEMKKTDILLHVESDNARYRSLTALSVSTKIPEYLSMGKCILAIGPEEVASMRLLKDNEIGYVISSELDIVSQSQKLQTLILNKTLRSELAEAGSKYAKKHFYAPIVRKEFMEILNNSIIKYNEI